MPTMDFLQPNCSILRIKFGKAASEDEVARVRNISSLINLSSLRSEEPQSFITVPKIMKTNKMQVI